MQRFLGVLVALGLMGSVLTAVSVSAAPSTERPSGEGEATTVAVVAIGQLVEDEGDVVTLDLRAAQRGDRVAGNLRFYCPDMGYYNGGVRTLEVDGDLIKVTGSGPLLKPDGARMRVRYQAEIKISDKSVRIAVEGRDDFSYTMKGALDPGLVRVFTPEDPKTQRPTRPRD